MPPEFVSVVADECLAVRVRLINRVISALYDDALRPFGLRVSQGNLLIAAAQLGDARPARLCRILQIEKSTLSRDIALMKSRGWIASEPPEGGRNHVLRVTTTGMALLARAHPAWRSAQEAAARLLGDAHVDALHRIAESLGLGESPAIRDPAS